MELKLNKIRTDIDQKLQEEVRTDKIHGNNTEVKIKTDTKHQKDEGKNNKNKNKNSKQKFFTVDGFKYENEHLDVKVEKNKFTYEEDEKGNILDTKK